MLPVLVGTNQQHILQTALICVLSLLRCLNHFHMIDVLLPFLSSLSSALEDNVFTFTFAFIPFAGSTHIFFSLLPELFLLPVAQTMLCSRKQAYTLTRTPKPTD